MKIAVLGTGSVGNAIGTKLASLGHEVRMGSRTADNPKAAAWAARTGGSHGTFADAAVFGEVVFNCTTGNASVAALRAAGADNLAGKVVIDVSNPLDFSRGMPPSLFVGNTDSLAETLQREFPAARIVKSLNTMNCDLMVDASRVPDSDVFVAGNDPAARAAVSGWLREWFGWKAPIDLGDLTAARGLEAWLPLWIRLWGTLKTDFNIKVARAR